MRRATLLRKWLGNLKWKLIDLLTLIVSCYLIPTEGDSTMKLRAGQQGDHVVRQLADGAGD